MFSFEQLRGFVAVAEELHFGRAAERLSMTQPPLSRQIQKLEREVGVLLLERDRRHVVLTAAGEAFLAEARRLLALAERAPDLARRISAGSSGTLHIGFTAASSYGVLGRLLNTVEEQLPEIDIELSEMVTREQVAALSSGELDLGLGRPPFDSELFGSRVQHREQLLVAVPRDHPLAARPGPLRPDDLIDVPLIMHSPIKARYFYDLVVSLLPISHQNVVHTVSQVLTMVWLVAAGRGIAFVPASATGLGVEGVVYQALEGLPEDPVELHLIWPRATRNPVVRRVLEIDPG
ncbi:LysR family transcriptional regulator [Nocardiopsis changdeensis]|uniref:LysR family transcriptional regulator n=1 Tax=Nocardiopsis changdeensis TaxID=2831969 RepID=A0ABX8BEH9_9ACTN|nr:MULTISPECIES: LysR family transcriptional regulator [Nocardiopsis]QUX20656.1 LysR family transcriptional regulator [Nocardiopsis changdeensis]QYX36588.1 LysR family transcriptional regulator [Nocardiopsis sp. MT53]